MFVNFYNYIILGAVQAVTEFLPISSSGHLILARDILHINDSSGLAFDAVLQLATTLAILVYFRRDFIKLVISFFKFIFRKPDSKENNLFLKAIIIGTLPAVILGILFEGVMDSIMRDSLLVATSLSVGALIMLLSEYLYKAKKNREELSVKKGFYIGLFQALALIPGMSRSGMVLAGGFFNNLKREVAVRYAFILSAPVLLGSGLKKLFDIWLTNPNQEALEPLLVGSIISFIIGILVIHYLIKYLQNHSLKIFAYYRIILSLIIILFYFA